MFSNFRYEGLGVKEIRDFLDKHHPYTYAYLPEPNLELPKVPKEWFGNVCATVIKDDFSTWVKSQVDARHKKVATQNNMLIQMDPEMAKIFQ